MSDTWQEFVSFSDAASAEAVAGLLRSEGVPTQVIADQPIPGLIQNVHLFVPSDLMHRAKWLTSQTQLTEAELVYLATGKLEGSENPE